MMKKINSPLFIAVIIFICYFSYAAHFSSTLKMKELKKNTSKLSNDVKLNATSTNQKEKTVLAPSSLVYLSGGQLVYTPFSNQGESNAVNVIPDFSNSGYRGGGVALPLVKNVITLNPIEGDATTLIQNAINTVSAAPLDANGHRGAVLLKAGVYQINNPLTINTSGVVLRGEGEGMFGTVILDNLAATHSSIIIGGVGAKQTSTGMESTITDTYVPTGTKTINISNGHGLNIGDDIIVDRTPNDDWINALDMAKYGWTSNGYSIDYNRKVVAINGNAITIDIPIVDPIQTKYGGGKIYKVNRTNVINECGVESLRFESNYNSDTDLDHAWNAIEIVAAENSWVKNVIAKYYGNGCVIVNSVLARFNTIQDCGMIDHKSVITGGNRYSFNLNNGTCNLFQRCYTKSGRHDFVTGARIAGPNVFLDGTADDTYSSIGPHQRWATGVLYDNIRGGEMTIQNAGSSGTGHGWTGAQNLFWNCVSTKSKMNIESPLGGKNWAIGCTAISKQGAGFWDSYGSAVEPRSLYLKQLEDRLGSVAVAAITTSEQVNGTLSEILFTKSTNAATESRVVKNHNGIHRAQYQSTKITEDLRFLVDDDINTKYFLKDKTAFWIQQTKLSATTEASYYITSANDMPTRDPKNWKLEASNDNSTWTVIDSKTNQTFANRNKKYTFTISNPQAYKEYRLTITANGGAADSQIADWGLASNTISTDVPAVPREASQQVELFNNSFGVTSINAYGWTNFENAAPTAISITSTSLNTVGGISAKSIRLNGSAGMSALPLGDDAGLLHLVTDSSSPFYAAFPILVAAAPVAGEYFYGLCTPSSIDATTQTAASSAITQRYKLYLKRASTSGKFQIGIQVDSEIPTYGDEEFDLNHKYQLVMKLNEANKNLDLYIIDGDLPTEVPSDDSEIAFVKQNIVATTATSGFSFITVSQRTGINMLIGGIIMSNTWPKAPVRATDVTAGGTIESEYNLSKPAETSTMLIDNNITTKYFYNAVTQYFTLTTTNSTVTYYTITSGNDTPTRDPKSWTLYGSNDGINWNNIHTVLNIAFPARRLTRTFKIPYNTAAYSKYRLQVTMNNGAPGLQFSEWRLYGSSTLPVKLVDFTAKAEAGAAVLNWQTAGEENNEKFFIERSTDGVSFTTIGEVKGVGTTQALSSYSFKDKTVAKGNNYYRLKQVDFDGGFEYSNVRGVKFYLASNNIVVYPNPFINSLSINGTTQQISSLTITDLLGRKVFEQRNPTSNIDVSSLRRGVYIITINYDNNKIFNHKIIKK